MGNSSSQIDCSKISKELCETFTTEQAAKAGAKFLLPGQCQPGPKGACVNTPPTKYCSNMSKKAATCNSNPYCTMEGNECVPASKRWKPYSMNKFLGDLCLLLLTVAILYGAFIVVTHLSYITPVRPQAVVTQPQVTRSHVTYADGTDTTAYLCSGNSQCQTISPYLHCTPTGLDTKTAPESNNAHQGATTTCASHGTTGASAADIKTQRMACTQATLSGQNCKNAKGENISCPQCMWNPDYMVTKKNAEGNITYDSTKTCQPVFTGQLWNTTTQDFGTTRQWKECRVPIQKQTDSDSNPAAYNSFTKCLGDKQDEQPLTEGKHQFPSPQAFQSACNACCTQSNSEYPDWKYQGKSCSDLVKEQMKKFKK